MPEVIHHYHRRKRIHEKHEPYPHPNKLKNMVDKLIYVVGIGGIIMMLPQLYKIWIEKNASGISVISFTGFVVANIFWLLYGILHREQPIIILYTLWIILNSLVVVGTILYR